MRYGIARSTQSTETRVDAVYALPAAKDLSPGIRFTESGDAEVMGEVFQGFAQAMGAGLMMVLAFLLEHKDDAPDISRRRSVVATNS